MIRDILLVGLGGAVRAMLRDGVTMLCSAVTWSANLGTILVNIIGSFMMGMLVSCCGQSPWLLMATVGICGGFTTFSTFSMQSVTLFQQGKYGMAALYILGTVIVCIAFAAAGCYVGKKMMHTGNPIF